MRRLLPYLLLIPFLVGCDHATKHLAKTHLPTAAIGVIDGLVNLTYVENRDVAFGVMRWIPGVAMRRVVILVGNAAMLVLLLWYWKRWATTLGARFGLSLVIAGALGNMIDRLARGYVVDFIHVRWWPVFNMADIFIVAGVMLLLLITLRAPDQRAPL